MNIKFNVNLVESLEGMFLVATPLLDGSFFEKSIIYVCAIDEDGVLGVVVNHNIGKTVIEEVVATNGKASKSAKKTTATLVRGGPVYTDQYLILFANKQQEANFENDQVLTIYTQTEEFINTFISGKLKGKFIIAQGVSSWDVKQLENEIAENSWIILPADFDTIFSNRVKNKWSKLIKKVGINNKDANIVSYTGHA